MCQRLIERNYRQQNFRRQHFRRQSLEDLIWQKQKTMYRRQGFLEITNKIVLTSIYELFRKKCSVMS